MQRLIARCQGAYKGWGWGGLRPFRNQVEVRAILLYPDHIESALIGNFAAIQISKQPDAKITIAGLL